MWLIPVFMFTFCAFNTFADENPPSYKPSSFSPVPLDISTNGYGASSLAPDALGLGEIAPDFDLSLSGGGRFSLSKTAIGGPVAIIFYRGHW